MKLLRLLYVASELAPLTPDSALAKENHFLPRAMAELGVDVTVALPGYAVPARARLGLARRLTPLRVPTPGSVTSETSSHCEVTVYEGSAAGGRVALVVLDLPSRSQDDVERMSDPELFCRAALEVARDRDAWPDVVLAGHGTEPVLEAAKRAGAEDTPAPAALYALRHLDDSPQVRSALAHADRIIVTSRSWAQEVRRRIEETPRSRDRAVRLLAPVRDALRGVPSGIDSIVWNPQQDGYLVADFSRDPIAGKAHHKAQLQGELGLRSRAAPTPLIAVLGPLDPRIITYGVTNALAQCNAHLVVLADEERDATSLRHVERLLHQAPNRVAVPALADPHERHAFEHKLLAAADFALLAHEFSPSGLGELYCMHYGAVPIAPATGSFADLIVEFDSLTATGNGFLYAPEDGEQLMAAAHRALSAYEKRDSFTALVHRVLSMDLSWRTAAQRYINIIMDLLRDMHRLAA